MNYKTPKELVDELAAKYKYDCIDFQESIGMASYSDGATRVNIYLTTMTVSTSLKHPKKGKTQLFRKNVSTKQLEQIFNNPRQHTGKGYYKK
ncbi:MAG: hypothetical protein R2800_09995 [Flavipsychrobacter sp.]